MDFNQAISKLPFPTQSYFKSCLSDHNLREDDPLVMTIVTILLVVDRQRRSRLYGLFGACFLVVLSGLIAWNCGAASGRSSAFAEANKHPVVTFAVPGIPILYGSQYGRQVLISVK